MAYRNDEQLARQIVHREGVMPFSQALSLCDKFLASWLQELAPRFKWFEAGDYELYLEPVGRGDFEAQIHARVLEIN